MWCPSRALVSNFSGWLPPFVILLSSPSLSLPLHVRLLPQGDLGLYLYLYLFHCACMFNSIGICAQVCLFWPPRESLVNDPLGMIKRNSLGSMIFLKLWWPSEEPSCWKRNLLRSLVILTYKEVFKNVRSTGEDFLSSFLAYWGTCVDSTYEGVSSTL